MKINYQNVNASTHGDIDTQNEGEETGLNPVLTGLWDWFRAGC